MEHPPHKSQNIAASPIGTWKSEPILANLVFEITIRLTRVREEHRVQ